MSAKILKFGPREPKTTVLSISIDPLGNSYFLPAMRSGQERRHFLAAIRMFHTELLDRSATLIQDSSEDIEKITLIITMTASGYATVSLGGRLTNGNLKEALKELMQLAICLAS